MPTIKTEHEEYRSNNPNINHPKHYTSSPAYCSCGQHIECIQITEHMGFCIGNAVKYIWRADLKGGIEDLEKAIWYIQREIQKRRNLINKAADQQTARFSASERTSMQQSANFINSLAAQSGQLGTAQGGQLKGDFESFKEYINETSKGHQDTKDFT